MRKRCGTMGPAAIALAFVSGVYPVSPGFAARIQALFRIEGFSDIRPLLKIGF